MYASPPVAGGLAETSSSFEKYYSTREKFNSQMLNFQNQDLDVQNNDISGYNQVSSYLPFANENAMNYNNYTTNYRNTNAHGFASNQLPQEQFSTIMLMNRSFSSL